MKKKNTIYCMFITQLVIIVGVPTPHLLITWKILPGPSSGQQHFLQSFLRVQGKYMFTWETTQMSRINFVIYSNKLSVTTRNFSQVGIRDIIPSTLHSGTRYQITNPGSFVLIWTYVSPSYKIIWDPWSEYVSSATGYHSRKVSGADD